MRAVVAASIASLAIAACGGDVGVSGPPISHRSVDDGVDRGGGNDPGGGVDQHGSDDPGLAPDPIDGHGRGARPCDPRLDDCGAGADCAVSASGVGVCVDRCALPQGEAFGPSPSCAPGAVCLGFGVSGSCVYPCVRDGDCPVVVGTRASCVEAEGGQAVQHVCAWGLSPAAE